jgi:hypothetical protein
MGPGVVQGACLSNQHRALPSSKVACMKVDPWLTGGKNAISMLHAIFISAQFIPFATRFLNQKYGQRDS